MDIPPPIAEFWRRFLSQAGEDSSARFFEAFHFDDNEPSANALAALVLAGIKQATASLLWTYEKTGGSPPQPGALSVVTYWNGTPACVIETIAIEVVPFEHVTAEFAAAEGEGDGSLAYWRQAHWAYFGRECTRIGGVPSQDMPIVCERFRVVFKAGS